MWERPWASDRLGCGCVLRASRDDFAKELCLLVQETEMTGGRGRGASVGGLAWELTGPPLGAAGPSVGRPRRPVHPPPGWPWGLVCPAPSGTSSPTSQRWGPIGQSPAHLRTPAEWTPKGLSDASRAANFPLRPLLSPPDPSQRLHALKASAYHRPWLRGDKEASVGLNQTPVRS